MRLLIDTQVFIWLINEDTRLGSAALKALRDTSNQVFISYFAFFEMTIKASVGKLDFDSSVMDDLPKMGIELIAPCRSALHCKNMLSSIQTIRILLTTYLLRSPSQKNAHL